MIWVFVSTLIVSAESANNYSVCDAYLKLEASAPCGPKGYALNYGLPICKNFIDNQWMFTPSGKGFLDCVRPCLADYITVNITAKHITNCTEINNNAFSSHVPCYDKCGFCDVVLDNLIPFALTFKISDFLSSNAIEQVITVGAHCLSRPLRFVLSIFNFGK